VAQQFKYVGEQVGPGGGNVFEVYDTALPEITLSAPEKLMGKIKIGDEIEDYRGNFLGIEILARDYRQIKVEVESGDAVILYSDCFFDAMNSEHERFGMERIKAAIKGVHPAGSAKEMMDSIMNSFDNFVQDHRLSDDLTVIILKKK
jgi:serine phosphatase RsbU (regulator of sigma subunit)